MKYAGRINGHWVTRKKWIAYQSGILCRKFGVTWLDHVLDTAMPCAWMALWLWPDAVKIWRQ